MNNFICDLRFEYSKVYKSRIWIIIIAIVVIIQPLLALVEAIQIKGIGIHATPLTNPQLLFALPPISYLGFDVAIFGQAAMVVLGAIIGAREYKNNELRTTFLCINNRLSAFLSKFIVVLVGFTILSFISIYITIVLTHIGLGSQGLNPISFNPLVWKLIAFTSLDWIMLTLLSFGFAMLFRNSIIAMIILLPQVVGLGALLASKIDVFKYFPVMAGNTMFASPSNLPVFVPLEGGFILVIWMLIFLVAAGIRFVRSDVGVCH